MLQSFNYTMTVKVKTDDVDALAGIYPEVHTISCTSRNFTTYDECVSSCKQLMDDVLARINGDGQKFRLGSEVNPIHSGQETLSKDWTHGEVSRLWIFDKAQEGTGHIHAIGQARIFGSRLPTSQISLN